MKKNLLKINSAHMAKEIRAEKYSWSISSYLGYFYDHKFLISLSALVSFSLAFTFFFDKEYNTKISYIINTNQSFQSNILASSLLGKGDNTVFSNLVERSYNHAKSRRFNKQLASIILKANKDSYVYQVIEKDFETSGDSNDIKNQKLLAITDFLEEKISVRLKDENQIVFSITSKDVLLTESIQRLINDEAKEILTLGPLTEVLNASKILNNQLQETKDKLLKLDKEKIKIQEEINSVNPVSLAGKMANIEANIEKELFVQRSTLSSHISNVKKLLLDLKQYPNDFSIKESIDSYRKKRESTKSKIQSLLKSLSDLKENGKNLPQKVSAMEKIKREQEILVKTAFKFTEKESLASISIQKIKESITLLSAEENVKSSKSSILILKSLVITMFMVGFVFTFIYYKQAFFPSVMTREEFEQTEIPITTAFSGYKFIEKESDMLVTVNNVSRDKIIREIKDKRIVSFIDTGVSKDAEKSISAIIQKLTNEGKKVFVLNFNISSSQRSTFRKLLKANEDSFAFQNINEQMNTKSILNIDKIKKKIDSKVQYDYILINGIHISSMANKALIANISDNVYAYATINKTRYSQLNNFVKLYNVLSLRSLANISLVLTRSKTGDSISNFLNEQINNNGIINEENSKAS